MGEFCDGVERRSVVFEQVMCKEQGARGEEHTAKGIESYLLLDAFANMLRHPKKIAYMTLPLCPLKGVNIIPNSVTVSSVKTVGGPPSNR